MIIQDKLTSCPKCGGFGYALDIGNTLIETIDGPFPEPTIIAIPCPICALNVAIDSVDGVSHA